AIADFQPHELGKPSSDGNGEVIAEVLESAPFDRLVVVGSAQAAVTVAQPGWTVDGGRQRHARAQVLGPHAAQHHAAHVVARNGAGGPPKRPGPALRQGGSPTRPPEWP